MCGVVVEAGGRACLHDVVCCEGVVGGRVEPGGGGAGGSAPVAEADSASGGGDGGEEEGVAVRMVRRDEGAKPGEGGCVVAPGDLYLVGDGGVFFVWKNQLMDYSIESKAYRAVSKQKNAASPAPGVPVGKLRCPCGRRSARAQRTD